MLSSVRTKLTQASCWGRPLAIFLTTAAVFFLLQECRSHLVPWDASPAEAQWFLTGDEPCYMLAGQAFAVGDGLNLRNVEAEERYKSFQDRIVNGPTMWTWDFYLGKGVKPLLDRSEWWGDAQIKHHEPLLPLLISPFSLSSRYRWLVAFFQSALVCLAVVICMLRYRALPLSRLVAVGASMAFFFGGIPISYYTTQVYPETVAGVSVFLALMLLPDKRQVASSVGLVLLLASPLVTPRVVPAVLALAVIVGARACRSRNILHLVILAVGLVTYFGYHLFVWGLLFPPAYDAGNRATLAVLPRGLLYTIVAPDIGMFFLNPVTWVGAVAGVIMLRNRGEYADWLWLATFCMCITTVGLLPLARAGTCPAGRYEVILCYLLAVPTIRVMASDASTWRNRLLVLLILFGSLGVTIGWLVAQVPQYWFQFYHPLFGYPWIHTQYKWLPNADSDAFFKHSAMWLSAFVASLWLYDLGRFCCRHASRVGQRLAKSRT